MLRCKLSVYWECYEVLLLCFLHGPQFLYVQLGCNRAVTPIQSMGTNTQTISRRAFRPAQLPHAAI